MFPLLDFDGFFFLYLILMVFLPLLYFCGFFGLSQIQLNFKIKNRIFDRDYWFIDKLIAVQLDQK